MTFNTPARLAELIHPDDRTAFAHSFTESARLLGPWRWEGRMVTGEGVVKWVQGSATPYRDPSGDMVWEGLLMENAERQQREEEVSHSAEQASQTQSEFLATLSQELRPPLNGVLGMTGLLLATELTAQQREFADLLKGSGEVLLAILNNVLDFSTIEVGKREMEVRDFDLREVVEETLDLVARTGQEKGLELVSLLPADVPTAVRGDPGRLRQVLLNLVSNALQFTVHGEVAVRVTREYDVPTLTLVRFAVSDTGIGIAPDRLDRLFQSFSQVDASTTRKYGGTGLGLAVCKQLVELMGGEIGVESTPGQGTTFWFTIQFEKQAAHLQNLVLQPRTDLHGLRVLVVDDTKTNRTVLHHYLTNWGIVAESGANGHQGLEYLQVACAQGQPYDIAILDYQMPGMDGLELAQRIKADPQLAGLKLVMLTSIVQHGVLENARHVGIDAYLAKPIRPTRLSECLTLLTTGGGVAAEKYQSLPVSMISEAKPKMLRRPLVLVAEDNTVNQKLATLLLERLGYRVDVVANGREAVEAVQRMHYAIVFMDCQMPEMDGFEATRIIRKQKYENDRAGIPTHMVPIIAMTANAMQGDRERCLAAGMDDYLPKPITPEGLTAVLERWVVETEDTGGEGFAIPSPLNTASIEEHFRQVKELLRKVGGDRRLLTQVSQMFGAEYPKMVTAVRDAISRQDIDDFRRAAHALKGVVGNMAAQGAYAAALHLEHLSREAILVEGEAALNRLEREVDGFQQALETIGQVAT